MKMTKRLMAMATCAVMTLSTAMSVKASAMDTTEQLTSMSESANTTITVINSISGYSNYAVTQIGSGSCWAACIMSVLKYHHPYTRVTFQDIYNTANGLTGSNMSVGDTISTNNLPVVIDSYLGMSNLISTYDPLTTDEVYNHIGANEPLIGIVNNGNNTYHAVVIYGFEGKETNGVLSIEKLRIMNPTYGICTTVNVNEWIYGWCYGYSNLI